MPGHIEWYNDEKTILLQKFSGELTLDIYYKVIDETTSAIVEQPHTVHLVIIYDKNFKRPPVLTPMMRYASRNMASNQGICFLLRLDHSLVVRAMINLARTIAPNTVKNIYFVDSIQEAEAYIAKQASQAKVD